MGLGHPLVWDHLPTPQGHPLHLGIAVVADVELGEGADVTHPHHLHCEVAEEVDDVEGVGGQGKDEDEGSEDGAQQLL